MANQDVLRPDCLLEMMSEHNLVARIGHPASPPRKCSCCKAQLVQKMIPYFCPVSDFVHAGALFPLYFQFIVYFSGLLFVSCLFSIVNICLNLMGTNCGSNNSFPCITSISNSLGDSQLGFVNVQTTMNHVFIVTSMIYLEFMTYLMRQRKKSLEIPTQQQYSVMYSGDNNHTFAQLHEIFQGLQKNIELYQGRPNKILKIGVVMRIYETGIHKNSQMIQDDGLVQDVLLRYSCVDPTDNIQSRMEADFSGKVILVLEYPVKPSAFNNEFVIPVSCASDIVWESIGLKSERSKKIYMLIMISILMGGTFLAILFFKKWIKKISSGQHQIFVIFLNLCIATIVAIFNSIEGIVIRSFARKELYPYHSKFFRIVARRLSYVFFINMVMTTFFANFLFFFESKEKDLLLPLDYAGLVNDFFFLFLTNSYMSSIFNYFDIFYGVKLLKRNKITKNPGNNPYSADQTRFIFEGHPVDMGLRYGNVMKTLFFTASISPLVPSGPLFSLLGMLICYWVDKYLLLRRYTCRYELPGDFADQMTEFSKFYVVLFAFTNLIIQLIPLNTKGQPDSSKFSWIDLYLASAFFAITLIYKFYFNTIKAYFSKPADTALPQCQRSYSEASVFFRTRFQDKLTMLTMSELGKKSTADVPITHGDIDQKLMETVRLSINRNKFDEDTI